MASPAHIGNDNHDSDAYPSSYTAWTMVALLMVANIFSFIDRQILGLLVDPVRHTLGISDFQIGLLIGPAFAIFYSIMALPLGRLVDRYRRVLIIAVGVGLWSLMTVVSGWVDSFAYLMLARIGVAVGEAVLFPAANSLIPDAFAPSRRARAIGTYSISIYLGAGLAFVFGGAVAALAESEAIRSAMPDFLAARAPWQIVFTIVGAPGILLALAILYLREPVRRGRAVASPDQARTTRPLRDFFANQGLLWLALAVGNATAAMVAYSIFAWGPTYLVRTLGLVRTEAGLLFGLAVMLGGIIGVIGSTRYADRRYAAGARGTKLWMAASASLACAMLALLLPLATNPIVFVILTGGLIACVSVVLALSPAALLEIAPNEVRGQALAGMQLATTLIGAGLGPPLVALAIHAPWNTEESAALALSVVAVVGSVVGAATFLLGQGRFSIVAAQRNPA